MDYAIIFASVFGKLTRKIHHEKGSGFQTKCKQWTNMYPLHNVALTVYTIITNKFDVDWKTTSPKSIFAPPKTFILEFLNECFRYCFSGIGLRVYTTIESPHSPDKYPKIHRISTPKYTE